MCFDLGLDDLRVILPLLQQVAALESECTPVAERVRAEQTTEEQATEEQAVAMGWLTREQVGAHRERGALPIKISWHREVSEDVPPVAQAAAVRGIGAGVHAGAGGEVSGE
jgi:hypothetical protein